jgi:hypothetical protein
MKFYVEAFRKWQLFYDFSTEAKEVYENCTDPILIEQPKISQIELCKVCTYAP